MPFAKVDRRRRRALLEVRLHGPLGAHKASFLLDTGSEVTSVDPALVDMLGYGARQGRRLSRLVGPGDAGTLGYVLTIDALEVLGTRHPAFEVHVHDMPREDGIDGLLGMDWLLDHVVNFDGPSGLVELLR